MTTPSIFQTNNRPYIVRHAGEATVWELSADKAEPGTKLYDYCPVCRVTLMFRFGRVDCKYLYRDTRVAVFSIDLEKMAAAGLRPWSELTRGATRPDATELRFELEFTAADNLKWGRSRVFLLPQGKV